MMHLNVQLIFSAPNSLILRFQLVAEDLAGIFFQRSFILTNHVIIASFLN